MWREAERPDPWHWFALTAAAGYLRDPRRRGERPYASALNNVLWDELRRNGLPEALHGNDAFGMAFSLESRMPFLDHRLVEFCFSLPFTDKISGGFIKSLLRRSMRDTVPEEILARRRKFGFLAPITHWLRLEPSWRQARDLLLDPVSLERGTSERRRLEVELNAFRHGPCRYARMRMPRVWRRISLELFFREFIVGAGLAPPQDGLPHVAAFGTPPATAPSLR